MKRMKTLIASATLGALVLTVPGCITPKPPAAIAHDSFSDLKQEEQQLLPKGMDFLTLEEAQNIAIQNNPTFKQAYYAISAARAQYYKAFSGYLPTVTVGYNLQQNINESLNRTYGNSSISTISQPYASATLMVFDSLQREMNLLAAKHNWRQTEQAELDARRLLLRSVAFAYNDVMLSQAKIKIAIADMKYNRELLKETELKFGVGASTLSDVLNFKVKYNTAESDLYTAQYTMAVSKFTLAELMGLTQGMIPATVQFPEIPSADGEMLADINVYLDQALANRPDLKQYREALESAKYSYYSSIAAFGPTVSMNASIAYNDTDTQIRGRYGEDNSRRNSRYAGFDWGVNVDWEIFSGGATYFTMRAQQAVMAQADYQLAATWIGIITDVRTAYENYIVCLKQVKLNQKNLEIVQKTRDLVNEEYIAGSTGITRLNEAQRDLVNAQTTLANAVIGMHNSKAQLLAAINAN